MGLEIQKERVSGAGKVILSVLAVCAVASLAVMAPNIFSAWGRLFPNKRRFGYRQLKNHLKYLENKKLVQIREKGGETIVEITEKGRSRALQYEIEKMKIKKPQKWDKKWRVVIFDIPEKKKIARDVLREKLRELGFFKLQRSVWLYPYECKDEIDFIKEVYNVGHYVTYLSVDAFDQEERAKAYFNL